MNAMNGKKKYRVNGWAAVLIAAALAVLPDAATAQIVSTEEAIQQSERERVREFLTREDAEDGLKQLGVAPEEARRRVDAMTPEEVQAVAGKIDTLAAGGALSSSDLIIILLIVIIVLILV